MKKSRDWWAGLDPESTLDYYKGILNGCREKTGDENYPLMIIDSFEPNGDVLTMHHTNNGLSLPPA